MRRKRSQKRGVLPYLRREREKEGEKLTDTNEPTRGKREPLGVYGTVGRVKKEMPVHYCVPGSCLIGLHPELKADAEKYLRAGTMWEVFSHARGEYRMMRLQLRHWNPENPRTCPDCKAIAETLEEQRDGMPQTPSKQSL